MEVVSCAFYCYIDQFESLKMDNIISTPTKTFQRKDKKQIFSNHCVYCAKEQTNHKNRISLFKKVKGEFIKSHALQVVDEFFKISKDISLKKASSQIDDSLSVTDVLDLDSLEDYDILEEAGEEDVLCKGCVETLANCLKKIRCLREKHLHALHVLKSMSKDHQVIKRLPNSSPGRKDKKRTRLSLTEKDQGEGDDDLGVSPLLCELSLSSPTTRRKFHIATQTDESVGSKHMQIWVSTSSQTYKRELCFNFIILDISVHHEA